MPTPYTADPAATEAPAAPPAFGVLPIVNLPADSDPPNGATYEQAYKVLADYVGFLMKRAVMSGWLGDQAVGDGNITTSSPAGGNLAYRNLVVGASGLLHFDTPGILRVADTLSIASGGIVRFGHLTNMNGGNGTTGAVPPTAAGAGGIGWNSLSTGYVGGGGNGGGGGMDDGHLSGHDGDALGTARMGGAGGAGGVGGTGSTAGAAGTSATFTSTYGAANIELLLSILKAGRASVRIAGTPPTTSEILLMGGSPGGGGGGQSSLATPPRTGGGGGGGAGGCVGIIIARNVVIAADGALFAPGGNGGAASDTGLGGGGGGGGGWIALVCGTYSGPTLTAAACCPGGTGGTGAGTNPGVNGSVGRLDVLNIGY